MINGTEKNQDFHISNTKNKFFESENLETQNLDSDEYNNEISSSSCDAFDELSNEEEKYFGNDDMFIQSSEEEELWADSESEEEVIREKYKKETEWINNEKFTKCKKSKQLQFTITYKPCIFKTNYNVKLIKYNNNQLCVVDTMNIIYILTNNKLCYTIKLDKWKVSDVCWLENKIYMCNSKFNRIKQISNGQIIDINKIYTRNIHSIINIRNKLYLLGDTTCVLNRDLDIEEEFCDKLINIVEHDTTLLALSQNRDLLQLSENLKLMNKIIYKDKFCYTNIIRLDSYLVILCKNSFIFVDKEFTPIKEINQSITNITKHKDFYVYFTDTGIKFLSKDFVGVKRKNTIKGCHTFIDTANHIVTFYRREMNVLEINKEL